jgi:nucleotide-binding universal stress UspA family protein
VDRILKTVREQQIDLIAMATHGRAGLSRVTAGSVTEEVLRKAEVPLLVTRVAPPAKKAKASKAVKARK